MKLLLENWRKYLEEGKSVSKTDIHKLADDKGILWDDDRDFKSWSEELTGKSCLDKMSDDDLETVHRALEKRPSQLSKLKEDEENIPDEVWDEIHMYLDSIGKTIDDVGIEQEVILASSKTDLEYWLKNKTDIEGEADPVDVDKICKDGKIKLPIIIDTTEEYTVEGRHRLAAALKCGLDVPVVALFSKDADSEEY